MRSIAPLSLICARPFCSTIAAGEPPSANRSEKTCCALGWLIVPESTSATNSRSAAGVNLMSATVVDDPASLAERSLMIQFATAFGFAEPVAAASKRSPSAMLSLSTSATPGGRPCSRMNRCLRASGSSCTRARTAANHPSVGSKGIRSGSGR